MNMHGHASSSLDSFPTELRILVMSHLKLGSLANIRLISRTWFNVFTSNQKAIDPIRRRLLALFDATVCSDVFQQRREDTKPGLDDFNRDTFLSQLRTYSGTLPEEFEMWVREWPFSAAMPEFWPGTDTIRLPLRTTWWNDGQNSLRMHNNHLAATPSNLYIDSRHPVLQQPWQQAVPGHPIAQTNYRLRATTIRIWEPRTDRGHGHPRLCLRGEGPLSGCVILCSHSFPTFDVEGREEFCTGHDYSPSGDNRGQRNFFPGWIDYLSYFVAALDSKYRHSGYEVYAEPPGMGIPPLCTHAMVSPWQRRKTGYLLALGTFLRNAMFDFYGLRYTDTASNDWAHPRA